MKRRSLLIIVLAICAVIGTAFTVIGMHNRTKSGFVDYASDAVWSKNSQALYYTRLNEWNRLYRYDTATGKKQSYDVRIDSRGYDISPDEKAITQIHGNGHTILVTDLLTGKEKRIYSSKNFTGVCGWLPQNKIIFGEYIEKRIGRKTNRRIIGTFIINPDGTNKQALKLGVCPSICASDGSGFLYGRHAEGHTLYYFYNMAKRTSTLLNSKHLKDRHTYINFLYLTGSSVIYEYDRSIMPDEHGFEILNLSTMQSKRIPDLRLLFEKYFSPDLFKYWGSKVAIETRHPRSLYLLKTPKAIVHQLRSCM